MGTVVDGILQSSGFLPNSAGFIHIQYVLTETGIFPFSTFSDPLTCRIDDWVSGFQSVFSVAIYFSSFYSSFRFSGYRYVSLPKFPVHNPSLTVPYLRQFPNVFRPCSRGLGVNVKRRQISNDICLFTR